MRVSVKHKPVAEPVALEHVPLPEELYSFNAKERAGGHKPVHLILWLQVSRS